MDDIFEIDIEELIKKNAERHGVSSEDVDAMLRELDASAEKLRIEPDALYMQLLDSISGTKALSKEQIMHQINVMLNNSGIIKCFPV